jgi:hypothetical protein
LLLFFFFFCRRRARFSHNSALAASTVAHPAQELLNRLHCLGFGMINIPLSTSEYLASGGPCRRAFVNADSFAPTNAWYSLDLPGIAHIISLNNYVRTGCRCRCRYRLLQRPCVATARDRYSLRAQLWGSSHTACGSFTAQSCC